MEPLRHRGRFATDPRALEFDRALSRFRKFCQFEPETGCVVWTGGQTKGRGHHVPYGVFWYGGRRWFAHRWAAKYIHEHDIDEFQTDHNCPNIPHPNTLCVEHLRPLTARHNRLLQETRKTFVHLQVGLLGYEDVYGLQELRDPIEDLPFYNPPAWMKASHEHDDTPSF